MTENQKKLLEEFKNLYGKRSYREISEMTGIQKTRIFRIFQGAEMKLYEFLVFKKLIDEKKKTTRLRELLDKNELFFSKKEIGDLTEKIERMMNLKKLIAGGMA